MWSLLALGVGIGLGVIGTMWLIENDDGDGI